MKKLQSYVVCFLLTWFPFSSGAQNMLNTYEYWFNNNYTNKQTISIINTDEHHFSEAVDVSALPDGVNVLNIRYRDENRLYSSTLSKVFYKTKEAEPVNKNLVAYELWFNNDFENRQVNKFSANTGHQVFAEINVSILPEGVNVLNIRYKDEKGFYSSTLSRIFYKSEESVLAETNITGYRYWFDNDYENAVYVQLKAPVRQFSMAENWDITHITKGAHSLHFQFLDSDGMWSVVTTDNITKSAVPMSAFTVSDSNNCSGTAVHFTNESIDSDTWQWEFGDGETSAESEPEHLYSEAGDFEVKLTAIDSETGRENSTTQVVTIFPSYESTLPEQNVEICASEMPYTFGTQQLHESGTYTETFSTIHGCDSTVTLNLTVHPVYNESGGSAVIICESDLPYTFGEYELTETGDYTHTFESIHGCDSTVTLRLTVNPIYHHTEEAVICDGESFSYNGIDYTESGEYQHTLLSVNGCDSLATLILTVNPDYNYTDKATICQGENYMFGTQKLTKTGKYTEVFESVTGCDSLVVLTLNVKPVYSHTEMATICQGETYVFGTQNLNKAGKYTKVFKSVTGCDSTVVLTLNVIPVYNHTDEATICQGDTFAFGTQNLITAGEYTEVFESTTGCDSTVVLTLNINPAYNHTEEVTICQGETFAFGTQNLTTAGEYTEVFESATGCDSTVVLTFNVNPVYSHTDEAVICQGETFAFGTQNLIVTGEYTEVFESVTGCDSIVVLTLNVNPVFNHTDEAFIVDGETYVFGSQNLVTAGEYTEVFESATGCDSTVVLTLSIPVGTELFFTSGIKTYPNPTTGKLYIDFPQQTKRITGIKVFNSLGMEVFHKVIIDEEHLEIDLGGCASGMYVLKASGVDHCITRKIILKTEY